MPCWQGENSSSLVRRGNNPVSGGERAAMRRQRFDAVRSREEATEARARFGRKCFGVSDRSRMDEDTDSPQWAGPMRST
jgi:hypothetical protein